MVKSGTRTAGLIVVESEAELLAVFVSPPPETDAEFVTLAGALAATFTVRTTTGRLPLAARLSARVQGPAGCVQFHPNRRWQLP